MTVDFDKWRDVFHPTAERHPGKDLSSYDNSALHASPSA